MKKSLKNYRALISEFQLALSVSILTLVLLESVKPGMVRAYLNLNYWLLLWVANGILYLYTRNEHD